MELCKEHLYEYARAGAPLRAEYTVVSEDDCEECQEMREVEHLDHDDEDPVPGCNYCPEPPAVLYSPHQLER
jgi:hypothetical protein